MRPSPSTLPRVIGVAAVPPALGGAVLAITLLRDHGHLFWGVFGTVLAAAFSACGVVAWRRRPENGTGRLLVWAGATWVLSSLWLVNEPVVFTIGVALGFLSLGAFAHVLLAFPLGRLEAGPARRLVAAAYATAVLANLVPMLLDRTPSCAACPPNRFLVADAHRASTILQLVFEIAGGTLTLAIVGLLVSRYRAATPARRRRLLPVYATGAATGILLAVSFVVWAVAGPAGDPIFQAGIALFTLIPFLVLSGVLRVDLMLGLRGLMAVADEPTTERAQEAIRAALGDPTALIAVRAERGGRYVDVTGERYTPWSAGPGRVVTPIESARGRLGLLEHDAALSQAEPELLAQVVNACRIAFEKSYGLRALDLTASRAGALSDALPDLVIRFDRDGTYLGIDGDTTGLVARPEEMLGRNVREFLPAEQVAAVLAGAERALATGAVQAVEYELDVGGVRRVFEARMVPSTGDEMISVVRDFTEQRRLERELQEKLATVEREQEFTRTVVNRAPSIFLLVDLEGRVVRFNQTCERLTGVPDDGTMRGRPFWEAFVSPPDRERARSMLREDSEAEIRWRAADGGDLVVATTTTALEDADGRPRVLVCGLDVTERQRHQEELRRSRARIVEAQAGERRRLERNLHDGAQQRLVSLSLALRLARARLSDPQGAGEILDGASEELAHALEELRELARGIHPAVLTDRGLAAALEILAHRCPVPVELVAVPDERLPDQVEAAAFFVVSESLANVAKYAHATAARVSVTRMNGRAIVEVADDGVGGADPYAGTGLSGLTDRVAVLDGSLVVDSPPGGGTLVRAEIPCR